MVTRTQLKVPQNPSAPSHKLDSIWSGFEDLASHQPCLQTPSHPTMPRSCPVPGDDRGDTHLQTSTLMLALCRRFYPGQAPRWTFCSIPKMKCTEIGAGSRLWRWQRPALISPQGCSLLDSSQGSAHGTSLPQRRKEAEREGRGHLSICPEDAQPSPNRAHPRQHHHPPNAEEAPVGTGALLPTPPPPNPVPVPTFLLDVGHPGGDGCFLAQPAGVLGKHAEGVGVAHDEVGYGAAGAGAALQCCEPFLRGEKRAVKGCTKEKNPWSSPGSRGPGVAVLTPLFLSDFCTV